MIRELFHKYSLVHTFFTANIWGKAYFASLRIPVLANYTLKVKNFHCGGEIHHSKCSYY